MGSEMCIRDRDYKVQNYPPSGNQFCIVVINIPSARYDIKLIKPNTIPDVLYKAERKYPIRRIGIPQKRRKNVSIFVIKGLWCYMAILCSYCKKSILIVVLFFGSISMSELTLLSPISSAAKLSAFTSMAEKPNPSNTVAG